jgi:hypothetical protein
MVAAPYCKNCGVISPVRTKEAAEPCCSYVLLSQVNNPVTFKEQKFVLLDNVSIKAF